MQRMLETTLCRCIIGTALASYQHLRKRPNVWPVSRGRCWCWSRVERTRHVQLGRLQEEIQTLQSTPSTFFSALRPTNQIFHVSWLGPSTHKYLFDFHKSLISHTYTLPGKVAISLVLNDMPVVSVQLRMQIACVCGQQKYPGPFPLWIAHSSKWYRFHVTY